MKKNHIKCCERLNGLYYIENEIGMNFRVIKNSDSFILEGEKRNIFSKNIDYKYILTNGYTEKLSSDSANLLFINYCPFCGKKLSKTFNNDDLINEINHIW